MDQSLIGRRDAQTVERQRRTRHPKPHRHHAKQYKIPFLSGGSVLDMTNFGTVRSDLSFFATQPLTSEQATCMSDAYQVLAPSMGLPLYFALGFGVAGDASPIGFAIAGLAGPQCGVSFGAG